ncbi:MAG: signal peptide peptidase SppA [Gemmataceae bacterium]
MLQRRCLSWVAAGLLVLLGPVHAEDTASGKQEKANSKEAKKTISVAHIKLSGSMDEKSPSVDPLLGQIGETFKQKIERIRKVRSDKDVQALLVEIDGLAVGWGKLNELSQAIASVRKAGKKVFAHVESGNRADYLLALAADEVCLPEPSWLMLTGIRAEVTFYKGILEKLGVKADMLQMGDFKAAAEPYLRDNLSEANRKQITAILEDTFEHDIVGRIAAARKLTPERAKQLIDEGPFSSRAALKAGLVDKLQYFQDYQESIKASLGGGEMKLVRDYGKKKDTEELDVFGLYRKLLFGPTKTSTSKNAKVAVIYASGAINTGKSGFSLMGGESVGSETMIKAIEEADKDATVKAIVLRIDSPGGSAVASDLIWNALRKCKKPILASMSDVAGSGGYYIAMPARKIYAEPGTITGSIGVIGGKMALKGLWEKVGIKSEVISRGKNSGILDADSPFTDSERDAFRNLMQDTYDQFVDKALQGRLAAGRKMTREQLLALAGGRIYTGRQAKENGLIDELGTLEDVIAEAAKLGGLPADKEPELLQLPKAKNSLESLLGSTLGSELDQKLFSRFPEMSRQLQGVDALIGLRNQPVWALLPFRLEIK